MSDSTLKELWQQVAEKKSCEAKQKELTAQRDTLADRLKKLEKSKLAEQADVDRLEGHSLAAFFYQVIGKMDEKLDKERQEAYAARVKYDAALHDLSSVDADLEQIQNRLERLSDCERQYQAALSEKIKSIKASAHPAAQQVAESESRIALPVCRSTAAFQQAAVFAFQKIFIRTFAIMRICGYNGGRKEWRCCKCFAVKLRNELLSCPLTRRGCCGKRFLLFATSYFLPESQQRM